MGRLFLPERQESSEPCQETSPRARESGHSRVSCRDSLLQELYKAGGGSGCLTATCPRWGRASLGNTNRLVGTSPSGPPSHLTFCPSPSPLLSRRTDSRLGAPSLGPRATGKLDLQGASCGSRETPGAPGAQGLTLQTGGTWVLSRSHGKVSTWPGGRTQLPPAATRADQHSVVALSVPPLMPSCRGRHGQKHRASPRTPKTTPGRQQVPGLHPQTPR